MKKVRWQERRHTLTKIFNYRNQGMNSTEIADALNAENHLTKKGLQWRNDNVDNFVYTCRKSGMREQTIKKEKQQILSVQPIQKEIKLQNSVTKEQFIKNCEIENKKFEQTEVESHTRIINHVNILMKQIIDSPISQKKKSLLLQTMLND